MVSACFEGCRDLAGGALVNLIHSYTENGDPFVRKVTDEHEREEDDHLQEDEVLDAEELGTVRDREHECLKVLRDEDRVRGDEAELRYRNRRKDGITHPGAVERTANIWSTIRMAGESKGRKAYVPPKLPDTVNLVFTSSKNE